MSDIFQPYSVTLLGIHFCLTGERRDKTKLTVSRIGRTTTNSVMCSVDGEQQTRQIPKRAGEQYAVGSLCPLAVRVPDTGDPQTDLKLYQLLMPKELHPHSRRPRRDCFFCECGLLCTEQLRPRGIVFSQDLHN